jgi:minor curlin subunit
MLRPLVAAAALAVSSLALAPPAAADGFIGLTVNPRTAEEAALVRMGLAVYALHQDIEANGQITQRGIDNAARISQGGCDRALIQQRGRGHTGEIVQRGCGNVAALFQSGRNTDGRIAQRGGQTGLLFLHGF